MQNPSDLKYTKEHEWLKQDGSLVFVGITHHAQDALGDIVYLELPKAGDFFEQGDVFGVVESVKATSDLFMPVSGTIVEINQSVVDNPSLVNEDPYNNGWMVKVEIKNTDDLLQLLSVSDYESTLE